MNCSVCSHPQRQAIDLALLNRTATLAELSRRHQLSQSALHRHKQHLLQKMRQTENRFHSMLNEGCLCILNYFLEVLMEVTRKARAEGNSRHLLQATRQGAGIIKFMPKLGFALHPDTVYRLLDSPLEVEAGNLLPSDLKFFAGSKQGLAEHLLAACPEPGAAADQALDDPTDLADLEDLSPELLQALLADLSQSLGLAGSAPTPPKREKSGKKAKKVANANSNHKEKQEDGRCDKNAGKTPQAAGRRRPQPVNLKLFGATRKPQPGTTTDDPEIPGWLKAIDEGRLDFDTLNAIGAGRPIDPELASLLAA